MRKHELTFANFICKFGLRNNLLDYAEQVVLPSFMTNEVVRTYGRTQYIFHKVKLVELAKKKSGMPVLALCGHFIKDTNLVREQVFDGARLSANKAVMQSSPSAFFILLLHNHRLLYYAETAHAPPLAQFQTTVEYRMRAVWRTFIDESYERLGKKTTKKELRNINPPPIVSVVPLAKRGEVPNLLKQLSKITSMKFYLLRPNDEPRADIALGSLEERFSRAGPQSLTVTASDSKGMDLAESRDIIGEALEDPSLELNVKGTYKSGEKATIENKDLALSEHVSPAPSDKKMSKKLYKKFRDLVASGAVISPAPSRKAKEIIMKIAATFL